MNLIFMNSLERKMDENRVKVAQVSICEDQGNWHVLWNEPREDGKMVQDNWFEGNQWDVMLQAFRERLREKMNEGFVPMLRGYGETERAFIGSKGRMTQMLHFYSEQHRHEEAYVQLRNWRKTVSAKEGRAAYMVASNRILDMIGAMLPQTTEELKQIPGFGEQRIRIYGEAVLKITQSFARQTEFPLDWVTESIDLVQFENWLVAQEQQREQFELNRQQQKRLLLEAISQGENLSTLQKRLSMRRSEILLKIEELVKDGYDVDILIDAELNAVSPEELAQVNDLFQHMGHRYLKPVLQKLYNEEELKGKDINHIYEWMRLLRLRFRKQAM